MEKIESFKVDHELLKRGLYVSRKDYAHDTNEVIATTFDIRIYLDQNLPMAKYEANKFYNEVLLNLKEKNLVYPN